jgi:excisionase family DNA binding protein
MKDRHDAIASPIMTTPEVARYLQVHQSTLYKLIRRGQIPVFKIGSDYRFDRDTIKTWMADRTSKFQILRPKSGPTPNLEH